MNQRKTQWEQFPDIMKTKDLQELLGVSKESVMKLVHQADFPKIRLHNGRVYLFVKSALQEYFHNQALGA